MSQKSAEYWIHQLELKLLPEEGGHFARFYTSNKHGNASAIWYLLTKDTFSQFHKVESDEIFTFIVGDPVEQFILKEEGPVKTTISNQENPEHFPTTLVIAGTWQASRLAAGGNFALLSCIVTPAFDWKNFTLGNKAHLIDIFPKCQAMIDDFF